MTRLLTTTIALAMLCGCGEDDRPAEVARIDPALTPIEDTAVEPSTPHASSGGDVTPPNPASTAENSKVIDPDEAARDAPAPPAAVRVPPAAPTRPARPAPAGPTQKAPEPAIGEADVVASDRVTADSGRPDTRTADGSVADSSRADSSRPRSSSVSSAPGDSSTADPGTAEPATAKSATVDSTTQDSGTLGSASVGPASPDSSSVTLPSADPLDTSAYIVDSSSIDPATPDASPATDSGSSSSPPAPPPVRAPDTVGTSRPIPSPQPAPVVPETSSSSAATTIPAGAELHAALIDSINSRHDSAGKALTARLMENVSAPDGRTLLPAGAIVRLTVAELAPAGSRGAADGKLELAVADITVNGNHMDVSAEVRPIPHELRGRGVTGSEATKVGVGAAAGAIVGQVLGGKKKTRATVIGGVVGAAGGAAVAAHTADRDVVVKAGTPITFVLTSPLRPPGP